MKTTIKVKGMHCDACKMLIKMELEEIGLEGNVESVELEADNQGVVVLDNVEEHQIEEARNTINKMDQYEVI
jgi:copper chaperone CopZ